MLLFFSNRYFIFRIITLSTPPFCVVHANKAFSMFSGLSNCTLVGKPIESILQVIQDIPTTYLCSTPTTVESLGSQIVSSNKPCQLRVVPITDRVRNSQGGMSHLLVKIEPSECQNSTINDTETKTSAPGGKGLDAHGNHRVFGTVG